MDVAPSFMLWRSSRVRVGKGIIRTLLLSADEYLLCLCSDRGLVTGRGGLVGRPEAIHISS